jgi:HK97 gp10 family phage protein
MSQVIVEFNHFAQYANNMDVVARKAVQTTIKRIEGRAKASLSGPRSGREYKRGKNGMIVHRASAPGEAPATDTGNLANSIRSRMTGKTEGEVTVGAEYATALELGSVYIAPRPFFAPAVKAEWPEFLKAMKEIAE